ncbi:HDOD domain-containing protein [Psychrobium sp. 1_MG-2023]|uniref:HDOD domain-containing protein n=1 Tax=Psychrobium sp. 1_MG-2023 TaxID=3062624 RepID=UPI000C32AA85|nr:HDOD domain-containing protein [Psychrobium sp. 1_MG-2023]MDP2560095.1 HDOD domain-containing protein [Psychrobium sp. 1_MG-2023]PKF56247.1 hypothetical protein CW748_09780 [Alteromonadales bacterium alter-6D02]
MLELYDFIVKANRLYTLPDICLKLDSLIKDPTTSADEVARLVSFDPALCFRVLKLANSALYSKKSNITSVEQAVIKIGTDELYNIALSTSAALTFKGAGGKRVNLHDYWLHSVYCAILAKEIHKLRFPGTNNSLFVAGLLHNIGLLVVLERLPYFVVGLTDVVGKEKKALLFEKETLGFSFSDISSGLLSHWGIGEELVETIRNQHLLHCKSNYLGHSQSLNLAIKLADELVFEPDMPAEKFITPSIIELSGLDEEQLITIIEKTTDNAQSLSKVLQG